MTIQQPLLLAIDQGTTSSRAILFDAPILILDEATASLDSKSEEVIQKSS